MAASSSTSSTMFSAMSVAMTLQRPNAAQLMSPANISFQGLRALPKQQSKASMAAVSLSRKRTSSTIKAELNPSLVITLSTGLSLFMGRFVFFNFQRKNVSIAIAAREKLGS